MIHIILGRINLGPVTCDFRIFDSHIGSIADIVFKPDTAAANNSRTYCVRMQIDITAIDRTCGDHAVRSPVPAQFHISISTILIFHLGCIRTDIDQSAAITVGLAVDSGIALRINGQIIDMTACLAACRCDLRR